MHHVFASSRGSKMRFQGLEERVACLRVDSGRSCNVDQAEGPWRGGDQQQLVHLVATTTTRTHTLIDPGGIPDCPSSLLILSSQEVTSLPSPCTLAARGAYPCTSQTRSQLHLHLTCAKTARWQPFLLLTHTVRTLAQPMHRRAPHGAQCVRDRDLLWLSPATS